MFKTHITMVVDRSGSMMSIAPEAQTGVNAFINEQKAIDGECTFSLYEFDNEFQRIYHGDIKDAPEYVLKPRGMTDLYGAVCRAVDETGQFLRNISISERPEKVVLIVMTDGQHNTYNGFSLKDAQHRLTHQQEKYSWEVSFLGAGLDVAEQAVLMGVAANHTHTFAPNSGYAVASAYTSHSHSIGMLRSTGRTTYAAATSADGTTVEGDPNRTSVQDA